MHSRPADFADFTCVGISIFDIYLRFDWKGPEKYDFQKIDAKMDEYRKLNDASEFPVDLPPNTALLFKLDAPHPAQ